MEVGRLLLLYNLDAPTAHARARELCTPHGAVEGVFVPAAAPLVPAHMLAVVRFRAEAEASAAAAALDGSRLGGRTLSAGPLAVEAFRQNKR